MNIAKLIFTTQTQTHTALMKNSIAFVTGVICLSVASVTPSVAVAQQEHLYSKFDIKFAGVPIGKIRIHTHLDDTNYKISASGRTAGVTRLFSDGKGTLTSSGTIKDGKLYPDTFSMNVVDEKEVSTAKMQIDERVIKKLTAKPALSKIPDRVAVKKQHLANILDPMSAFLMPWPSDSALSNENACNRTIPIFDGWKRYDIKLHAKGRKKFRSNRKRGYDGQAIVCGARYAPIAGHRASKKEVKYMQKNKKMEIWLIPMKGNKFLTPVYVKIGTKYGTLSLKSTIYELNGN